MTVSLSIIQTAFINGINATAVHNMQLGTQAPDYLAMNIDSGFEVLRQIGLGSEPHALEGPIRILAIHKELTTDAKSLDPEVFLQKNAQDITALLHALLKTGSIADAQQILGGLTVFDDDARIRALLVTEVAANVDPGIAAEHPNHRPPPDNHVVDMELVLDVTQFADYVAEATRVWSEYHARFEDLDKAAAPDARAESATRMLFQLLRDNPKVRRIICLFYLAPKLLERYPIVLEQQQIEAYLASKEAFEQALTDLLQGVLPPKTREKMTDEKWQPIWRIYWRQTIGAAELFETDDVVNAEQIVFTVCMRSLHVTGFYSWKNLWGWFRNPYNWFGRR